MFSNFFKLSIGNLVNLLNWTITQLQDRAIEKVASATAREEAAQVLLDEAAADRTEAKVAVNMADKLIKLMK